VRLVSWSCPRCGVWNQVGRDPLVCGTCGRPSVELPIAVPDVRAGDPDDPPAPRPMIWQCAGRGCAKQLQLQAGVRPSEVVRFMIDNGWRVADGDLVCASPHQS